MPAPTHTPRYWVPTPDGPLALVGEPELAARVRAGLVAPDAPVCPESGGAWRPAAEAMFPPPAAPPVAGPTAGTRPAPAGPLTDPALAAGANVVLSGAGGYAGPFGWGLLVWFLFRRFPVLMWSLVGLLVAGGVAYKHLRDKPAPPPDPMAYPGRPLPLAVEYRRAKLSEHGLVARLTNTSPDAPLGTVWARPAGGP